MLLSTIRIETLHGLILTHNKKCTGNYRNYWERTNICLFLDRPEKLFGMCKLFSPLSSWVSAEVIQAECCSGRVIGHDLKCTDGLSGNAVWQINGSQSNLWGCLKKSLKKILLGILKETTEMFDFKISKGLNVSTKSTKSTKHRNNKLGHVL